MNTEQAFKELINIRGWWIGVLTSAQLAITYKNRFKQGTLTIDTMTSCLEKSKIFNKDQETKWSKINQTKQNKL